MKIQSQSPQNPVLSNSIECFYIIEQTESEKPESFLILPSVYAYLSISLDTISELLKDGTVIVCGISENSFDSSVQIGLKSSCVFQYRGAIKELCIKFKPLGIYDFFDEKKLLATPRNNQTFVADKDYQELLTKILNYTNNTQIFEEIEKYLLERYAKFSHTYLFSVIDELEAADSENQTRIEELSDKFSITRQTLNSQFKKYLNLSPSEFRQIRRFRKLIQSRLIDGDKSTLTEFVYAFGFFDQSHLIKEFRKYTFLKPNDFFRKVVHSNDQNILVIWQ